MNKGYNTCWPTNIYLGHLDQTILENVGQTILSEINLNIPPNDFQKFDLLDLEKESIQDFKNLVVWPAFEKYLADHNISLEEFPDRKIRSWITGVYQGYMIPAHNHSGASLSAIFYLLCSQDDKGGELILLDSRSNANRGYKDAFKPWFENKVYKPKTGEFLIFPSYIYHHTVPFTGNLRLAVPVDLYL